MISHTTGAEFRDSDNDNDDGNLSFQVLFGLRTNLETIWQP